MASECKVKALLVLLLLVGGECVRVYDQARLQEDRVQVESMLDDNNVCRKRDMNSPTKALMRYHQNALELKMMSSSPVFEGEYTINCGLKLVELKQRTSTFYSCAGFLSGASGVKAPAVLAETMGSGEEALSELLKAPMNALSKVLQTADFFPLYDDLGQCKFDPTNLNPEGFMSSSSPSDDARKQLFGADCNATASEMYTDRLPGLARKAVEGTLAHVKNLIRWKEAGGMSGKDEVGVSANMTQKLLEEFFTYGKQELERADAEIARIQIGSDLIAKDESDSAAAASALIEKADWERPEWTKNWKMILLVSVIVFFVIFLLIIFLAGVCSTDLKTCLWGISAPFWGPFWGIWKVFQLGMNAR
jgi:hypothetical protein